MEQFNELVLRAATGPVFRKQAQAELGMDQANWDYFFGLIQAYRNPKPQEKLALADASFPLPKDHVKAISPATADESTLAQFPVTEYESIRSRSEYLAAAKE